MLMQIATISCGGAPSHTFPERSTVGSRSTEGANTIKTTMPDNNQAIAVFGSIGASLRVRTALGPSKPSVNSKQLNSLTQPCQGSSQNEMNPNRPQSAVGQQCVELLK